MKHIISLNQKKYVFFLKYSLSYLEKKYIIMKIPRTTFQLGILF